MNKFCTSILLAFSIFLSSCSKDEIEQESLSIYVASSLTEVIQEIGDLFKKEYRVDIHYNFAASGALAQQIIASPRADIFISASQKWMDKVEEEKHIITESRKTLLSNQLVIICNQYTDIKLESLSDMGNLACKYLSIGNPNSVPAGRYAKQCLSSIDTKASSNLWNEFKNKISPTPNVRSSLIQVEGNDDVIGIVYKTDYFQKKEKLNLIYEIPLEEGPKIEYSASIIKNRKTTKYALDFMKFIQSDKANAIFKKYGFIPIE